MKSGDDQSEPRRQCPATSAGPGQSRDFKPWRDLRGSLEGLGLQGGWLKDIGRI